MRGSHFSCEPANKCLNVCEWVEVVERNKSGPCLPLLTRELSVCESVKENQIENENKKKTKKKKNGNLSKFVLHVCKVNKKDTTRDELWCYSGVLIVN